MIDNHMASLLHQHPNAGLNPIPNPPTTPDGDMGPTCAEALARRAMAMPLPATAHHTHAASLLQPSLAPPFPSPAPCPPDVATPLDDPRPNLTRSFFDGFPLPSPHVSLSAPPAVKISHNLRLPSFDLLGIAAPHPDRFPLASHHSFSLGAGPLSKPEDPLHELSPPLGGFGQLDGSDDRYSPITTSPRHAKPKVDLVVPVVTPPTEPGVFHWGSVVNVNAAGLGSPPSSDPALSPNLATVAHPPSLGQANIVVPTTAESSSPASMVQWTQSVQDTLVAECNFQAINSVKILSHALPCPSTSGHLFGQLIAAIHDRTATSTAWINVFHAVPGRFTLSDLPKSPPSTPGPAVGGDEYFTSKVFDSAVAIPDYQLDSKLLPPSPRPVVPPGSVNISVVERYIPPTNTNEYAEMFLQKGRSLLHDRLVEMSSDDGLLLFIYPTRTGARTFMQEYLGPILDPLLRSITVVHDLSSELGRSLGQMGAVAYLDEYQSLKAHVERFCNALNETATGDKKPFYQIIRASKEEAVLERSTWANDWWIKQEKPRIRDTINKYFRQVKKLPESEMTGSHLLQEILDGVANRKFEDERPSPKGVEIGVFIVKKTKMPTKE